MDLKQALTAILAPNSIDAPAPSSVTNIKSSFIAFLLLEGQDPTLQSAWVTHLDPYFKEAANANQFFQAMGGSPYDAKKLTNLFFAQTQKDMTLKPGISACFDKILTFAQSYCAIEQTRLAASAYAPALPTAFTPHPAAAAAAKSCCYRC